MDDNLDKMITDLSRSRETLLLRNYISKYLNTTYGYLELTDSQNKIIDKISDRSRNHILLCSRQVGVSGLISGLIHYINENGGLTISISSINLIGDNHLLMDMSEIDLIIDSIPMFYDENTLKLMNKSKRVILFERSYPGTVHDLIKGDVVINNGRETSIHILPVENMKMKAYLSDIEYRREYLCEII